MTTAPEKPTIEELHTQYPLSPDGEQSVQQMRSITSYAINNFQLYTLGVIGYCARPGRNQADQIMRESNMIAEVHDPDNQLVVLHRGPMWKPRTNPDDWHGEETTDPEGVFETMRDEAELQANLAVEIGHPYHLERYGHLLSFMWTGGRNVEDDELMKAVAQEDPTIPLGIKNGLDGSIDRALEQVELATQLRGSDDAPVILIYRGGENARTPEAWLEAVQEVYERTGGRFLLDTAHGSEMAHDPKGSFKKSVDGQVLAVYAMNRLVRQGYILAGTMMEASGVDSPTDPHMPLAVALQGVKEQHRLKAAHTNDPRRIFRERVPHYL